MGAHRIAVQRGVGSYLWDRGVGVVKTKVDSEKNAYPNLLKPALFTLYYYFHAIDTLGTISSSCLVFEDLKRIDEFLYFYTRTIMGFPVNRIHLNPKLSFE